MPLLVYLFGEPGAGKSTLTRDAIGGIMKTGFRQRKPFAHTIFPFAGGMTAYLGEDDGKGLFPGTDRLSMGAQPLAIKFLRDAAIRTVIAEGDRLATVSFFEAALQTGHKILAVHVVSSQADRRRKKRATQAGKKQNETWVKGRISKVEKLAEYCRSKEGNGIRYEQIDTDQARPDAGKKLLKLIFRESA